MGEVAIVNGVDLGSLSTEEELYKLLDATEDFDERKKVRARLRQLQAQRRAESEAAMKRREQEREEMILQRKRDAEESKKRMLSMYQDMAKSGGDSKKRDLMQEAIEERQKAAIEQKRKMLAAYDAAAKSGVPGPKTPAFDAVEPSKSVPTSPSDKKMDCTSGSILPKTTQNNVNKISAKAKFQQMDSVQNKQSPARPNFRVGGGGGVMRSASDIKDMLLHWCKSKTKEYGIEISNFSTSWNDGMAFCALIHHFYPDAFDFQQLNPKNRRHNFDLAFRTAEEKADIAPLLDVEDMVLMKKPDWKCVFTYVQSIYRHLHDKD